MKTEDRDKLSKCIGILGTTSLGLPMVWLWTWSVILDMLDDESYNAQVGIDTVWAKLCEDVAAGKGFSLEYGSEQHWEEVLDWMNLNEFIMEPLEEEEED